MGIIRKAIAKKKLKREAVRNAALSGQKNAALKVNSSKLQGGQ